MKTTKSLYRPLSFISLMALAMLGHGEIINLSQTPQRANVSQTNNYEICYQMDGLADKILAEKYEKIPLNKMTYYKARKNPNLVEHYGDSTLALEILTETIYELPYLEDLNQRRKQEIMVSSMVSTSCIISLHSMNSNSQK